MTREDILGKACELQLAGGLERVTMRTLARELGVTAPALYRHYASREALLVDVVSEAYRLFAEALTTALQGRTPAERFRWAGQGYLDFALAHPRYYGMLYMAAQDLGIDGFPEAVTARIASIGQFWTDRVRECIDAGLLQPIDPDDVTTTLWAHAHGLISLYLRGCLPMDEDQFRQVYRDSSRRALHGLATAAYAAEASPLEQP